MTYSIPELTLYIYPAIAAAALIVLLLIFRNIEGQIKEAFREPLEKSRPASLFERNQRVLQIPFRGFDRRA